MKIENFSLTADSAETKEYTYNKTIATTLGEFKVELWIHDGEPLDQDMVDQAIAASSQVTADFAKFHDLVYADYRECVEEDPEHLECFGVSIDLKREQISDIIDSRLITVSRDKSLEYHPEIFSSRFYISPEWEEEHGFYLSLNESELERVDC